MAIKNYAARNLADTLECVMLCGGKVIISGFKSPQKVAELLFILNEIVIARDSRELQLGYFGMSFDETHSQKRQTAPILSVTLRLVTKSSECSFRL